MVAHSIDIDAISNEDALFAHLVHPGFKIMRWLKFTICNFKDYEKGIRKNSRS